MREIRNDMCTVSYLTFVTTNDYPVVYRLWRIGGQTIRLNASLQLILSFFFVAFTSAEMLVSMNTIRGRVSTFRKEGKGMPCPLQPELAS